MGASAVVARQYAYAHSTLLTWVLMGLCAAGVDIVELGPTGGERHDEDGWKSLNSLCEEGGTPVADIDAYFRIIWYYLRVPGAH
jgi:hypothetical protein